MPGYNLPESTGPNDPEAPWNQTGDEDEMEKEAQIIDLEERQRLLRDGRHSFFRLWADVEDLKPPRAIESNLDDLHCWLEWQLAEVGRELERL